MCRRFFFWAGILIAFGAGLLLSLCVESGLIRLLIGAGSILGGFFLLKR